MPTPTTFPRTVPQWWPTRVVPFHDALLTAAVTVLAFTPPVRGLGPEIGDLPPRGAGPGTDLVLTLAMTLPLLSRSRWPQLCLPVIGAAFALGQVSGQPETFGKVGLLLALYAAGAYAIRFRAGLAAVMTGGYAVLAIVLHGKGSPQRWEDYVAFYSMMAVVWMAGTGMRRWRREEAERRRLTAAAATTAERARIARDLHDVVTHHVTAMVVQSDAARFLLDNDPARAGDGLAAIGDTGRRALTELRSLLGVLEATGDDVDAERTPTMGRIADLVEQAAMTGQPVELTETGTARERSVAAELAAYRVVQESLTNAVKYAPGRRTTVLVRHGADHVDIEVTTPGPAPDGHRSPTPSGGRGLAGLRERVRMLGGDLVSGTQPDGGFRVSAHIPAGTPS